MNKSIREKVKFAAERGKTKMKTSALPTNEDGAAAPNEDVRFAH